MRHLCDLIASNPDILLNMNQFESSINPKKLPLVALVTFEDPETQASFTDTTVAELAGYGVKSVSIWWLRNVSERADKRWTCPTLTTLPAWLSRPKHLVELVQFAETAPIGQSCMTVIKHAVTQRPIGMLIYDLDAIANHYEKTPKKAFQLLPPHLVASWQYYQSLDLISSNPQVLPPSFELRGNPLYQQPVWQQAAHEITSYAVRQLSTPATSVIQLSLPQPTVIGAAMKKKRGRPSTMPTSPSVAAASAAIATQKNTILRYFKQAANVRSGPSSTVVINYHSPPVFDFNSHPLYDEWSWESAIDPLYSPDTVEETLKRSMEFIPIDDLMNDCDDDYAPLCKKRPPLTLIDFLPSGEMHIVCEDYFATPVSTTNPAFTEYCT